MRHMLDERADGIVPERKVAEMTAEHDYDERERILDAALELAEEKGWERVRLHEVARAAGVGLERIHRHFPEKEALVDAWFDRADRAMLKAADAPGFYALPLRERLERLLWAWLDALASHRRVTRQMLLNKLEPGHLHVQILGIWRISRTVQWWREAAGIRHAWLRRALEETALTAVYLAVFLTWLEDDSPDHGRTRRRLRRLLELGEGLGCCPSIEAPAALDAPEAEGQRQAAPPERVA